MSGYDNFLDRMMNGHDDISKSKAKVMILNDIGGLVRYQKSYRTSPTVLISIRLAQSCILWSESMTVGM